MFSWLEYSTLEDKAFCYVCRMFYNPEETISGFCKWKKAVKVYENHEKRNAQRRSNSKFNSLKDAEKSGTVIEKVNKSILNKYKKTDCT